MARYGRANVATRNGKRIRIPRPHSPVLRANEYVQTYTANSHASFLSDAMKYTL